MPVHNALPYLDAAIESILGQTHRHFEFVILDDCSTDGSGKRLREWAKKDSRIRLVRSRTKLGPAGSSQRVAEEATAPIVARMDADDIAHADRLRQQLEVLAHRPDVGLVASLYDLIDQTGRKIRGRDLWRLVRKSPMVPFPHDAIMYRQEIFLRAGGYLGDSELWEDQDLITRMAALARIMVIPQSLMQIRQTATSTRSLASREGQERAVDAMYRRLSGDDQAPGDEKLDPRVFLSLGSVELWSGGHPRLFRRLLSNGRLSLDGKSLAAIGWTACASLSPAALRQVLRGLAGARNLAARIRMKGGEPVVWEPAVSRLASERRGTSTRKAHQGEASS